MMSFLRGDPYLGYTIEKYVSLLINS